MIANIPTSAPFPARDGLKRDTPAHPAPQETAIAYCGICRELYEYLIDAARDGAARCPLCGYYVGDC